MKSGIYSFKSNFNGKMYIGFSNDVYYRRRKHLEQLRGQRHFNNHLQAHFNKYGEEDLMFDVIEFCPEKNLSKREVYWIDKFHSFGEGFNQTEGGNLREYSSKTFCFENIKTGEIINNITAKNFAKLIGCSVSAAYHLERGDDQTVKGWKLKGHTIKYKPRIPSDKTKKRICITNKKTGEDFIFSSQSEASKILKIKQAYLSNLYLGKARIAKGYILTENKNKIIPARSQRYFTLLHPIHGEYEGYCQQDFCKKFGIAAMSACRLINGKCSTHKGWIKIR